MASWRASRLRRSIVNPIETLRSVVRLGPIETDPVERRLARAASVADLRRIAQRRLPGGVFDYIDGAAEDERTLAANERAFADVTLPAPRAARHRAGRRRRRRILGRPLAYPLVLAPTGFTRIADPQGELAVARAAARAGLPYTLSTLEHPLDRGGARGQRRAALVPGLRVARPRAGQGDDRAGRGRRATRRSCSPSTPRCSAGASATCAAASRCRPTIGPAHDRRRRAPPGVDVGVRAQRADPVRQRRRAATSATARRRSPCPTTSTPSSTRRCRGTTSTGCARCGTARSCSRASRPSTTRVLAADAGVDAIALSNHGGRQLDGAPATLLARRAGRRRGRRPHRDHLRRRRAAGQRHRQGGRRRRHRVHGRPRVPLRPRRRRRARRRPPSLALAKG